MPANPPPAQLLPVALLPCPFCTAEMVKRPQYFAHPTGGDCVLRGAAFAYERATAWNTRATSPERGELASLVEAAYREGHQTGRCDGSIFEVDADWLASEAHAALHALSASPGDAS